MSSSLVSRSKRPLRYVMGFAYVLAGVAHFLSPSMFARIVPPQLPRPRALVYLSGIAEIVLGVGVLFERTRNVSAWGIVALLVAVFPANVYMATSDELDLPGPVGNVSDAALWARLPLQAVLVAWALWYTNRPQSTAARDE
nr:DoxX family membrane protein [Halapricum salinum]